MLSSKLIQEATQEAFAILEISIMRRKLSRSEVENEWRKMEKKIYRCHTHKSRIKTFCNTIEKLKIEEVSKELDLDTPGINKMKELRNKLEEIAEVIHVNFKDKRVIENPNKEAA